MNPDLVIAIVWFAAGLGLGVILAVVVMFREVQKTIAAMNAAPIRHIPSRKEQHDR